MPESTKSRYLDRYQNIQINDCQFNVGSNVHFTVINRKQFKDFKNLPQLRRNDLRFYQGVPLVVDELGVDELVGLNELGVEPSNLSEDWKLAGTFT